jgi:hypothetical protein
MDPKIAALIIDGIGMFAAIAVGYAQLRYGFQVFTSKETKESKTKLSLGKWRLDTSSTGVAVMGLAALWAFAAIKLRPVLNNRSATSYDVASANWDLVQPGSAASRAVVLEFAKSVELLSPRTFKVEDARLTSIAPNCSVISVPELNAKPGSDQSKVNYLSFARGGKFWYVPITSFSGSENKASYPEFSLTQHELKSAEVSEQQLEKLRERAGEQPKAGS